MCRPEYKSGTFVVIRFNALSTYSDIYSLRSTLDIIFKYKINFTWIINWKKMNWRNLTWEFHIIPRELKMYCSEDKYGTFVEITYSDIYSLKSTLNIIFKHENNFTRIINKKKWTDEIQPENFI